MAALRPLDEIIESIFANVSPIEMVLGGNQDSPARATENYLWARFLAQTIASDTLSGRSFTVWQKKFSGDEMLRDIIRYGNEMRDLGGYYLNHVNQVARKLSGMGADFVTIQAGMKHDLAEQVIAKERAKGNLEPQKVIAETYIDGLTSEVMIDMLVSGAPMKYANSLKKSLSNILLLTTSISGENKWAGMSQFFRHPNRKEGEKATAVKFADRLDVTGDFSLLSPESEDLLEKMEQEGKLIMPEDVANFLSGNNYIVLPKKFSENRAILAKYSLGHLQGHRKINNYSKNSVLTMMKRLSSTVKGFDERPSIYTGMIDQMELELLDLTLSKQREQKLLMINTDIPPYKAMQAMLGIDRYVNVMGGLDRVTRPAQNSPFDGYFAEHFDRMLAGDIHVKARMGYDKQLQFRSVLLLEQLFLRFRHDRNFVPKGITVEGIDMLADPAWKGDVWYSNPIETVRSYAKQVAASLINLAT